MPVRHDLLKSARQHNYCRISGCSQQLSVWEVKITPCSLTAGSLSALNYTKLVQHISLPEQEPECCGTCLTRSKQCSLNQLGMTYLEPAAICLRHDAQHIKTKWVSNSFIMHCGNNLCRKKTVCTICGLGFFCAGNFWTFRSGRTARDSVTLFKKPQLTLLTSKSPVKKLFQDLSLVHMLQHLA